MGLNSVTRMHFPPVSGGQRSGFLLPGVAMAPRFIVADERFRRSMFGAGAGDQPAGTRLQQEFGLTYLFYRPRLSVIYYISTRVAVMY